MTYACLKNLADSHGRWRSFGIECRSTKTNLKFKYKFISTYFVSYIGTVCIIQYLNMKSLL